MSAIEVPICRDDDQRRADVLAHATANGIDFVEVDAADHRQLSVFFLKPLPPADILDPNDPDDAYGITADLSRTTIEGGARIVGITVVAATRQADGSLHLVASAPGDYSRYRLTIDVPQLDPVLNTVELNFMATCPVDFDCRQLPYCPPAEPDAPQLDYLAKDYASFRRLLLELGGRLNPKFREQSPADLGVALVELLAYTGDHLSYFQDAVANEAYLETARQRPSVKRHARLVDYRMHDGRNAWTWVHLAVNVPHNLVHPPAPQPPVAFVTRLSAPLAGTVQPPGLAIEPALVTADTLERDPALSGAVVFELAHGQILDPHHNAIRIHAWGNEECCLPAGSRVAYLYSVPDGVNAVRPALAKGDFLLFEEVKGPATGLAADADPARRQVVEIDEEPAATEDPVYQDVLAGDALQRRVGPEPALPLLRVRWRREDALAAPFCLSTRQPGGGRHRNVSLARGNMVLVDHGLTVPAEEHPFDPPVPADQPFRLALERRPLTFELRPPSAGFDPTSPRRSLAGEPRQAQPAVRLAIDFPTDTEDWAAVPDLLDSPPLARHFVAETESSGAAVLRFGDGEYGREPAGATRIVATYRVGNGAPGNVGREAIAHLLLAGGAPWLDRVRNPLAATGGIPPESLEEVKRRAPQAFRAEQFRAVTEADYSAAANKLPEVAGAVATFRWTGSWYTVFVGVDPRDPEDLVRQNRGLTRLSPRLEARVRAFLTRYRLAGYDLEIRPPRFVPLEIEIDLCVSRDHFRGDVARAVREALGNRVLATGGLGFFHPDNFTFGQPVYLSRLYAAVEAVEGVESAVVRSFRRQGQRDNGELENGVLPIGPWEIAQLDNDPNFMENGVLEIIPRGGKA